MNRFTGYSTYTRWPAAFMLAALVAACGGGSGGRDPILGTGAGAVLLPAVTVVAPASNATGVPVNIKLLTAAFTKPMDGASLTPASFRLACPAAVPVTGTTVSYQTTGSIASLALPAASNLPISTVCTATVTTAVKDSAGNALANDFVWTFRTSDTSDTTAPTVSSTEPVPNATGVATNRPVTAIFGEAMDPATINGANFSLACPVGTAITGSVTYAVSGNVATLTPASALPASTACTATVTTGVKDAASNAMASPFVWVFTTGASTDTTPPALSSTNPVNLATNVPRNQEIAATFSEAMDPLTITTASMTLKQGVTPVSGSVSYLGSTATFSPTATLGANTVYTVAIANTVKDLAGNTLAAGGAPNPWTFTTAAALPAAGPALVNLDCAASFAILAGSTVTSTGPTIINGGDLGLSPGSAVTGFPPGTIIGGVQHVTDPTAANAKLCLTAAYIDAAGRTLAPITVAGNIGGQTLAPGLYKSTSTLAISSGDLTLAGPADAVWIFQIASTLTTTAGRQVILSGGALAKNVFWQVGTSATLGTTSVFQGNILADQSITLNTGATLNGRALTRIGAVTLDAAIVNIPAP